jgi:hypothetical protein
MFGKVEAKEFAPFINSIDEACVCRVDSSGHVLSSSDERILLKLIVNFLVRNPNAKDLFCHVKIPDSICTSQEYNDVCLLFKQLGLVGADSVFKAALKRNALSFDDGCLPDMLYSSFEKLPYVFYYSKEGEFITCDSPVLCSSDVSITDEDDTCIYMPLTPKVAVMLGNYKSFKNNCNTARELSNRQIRIFNEALINQSAQYRWIIASSELVLKKYF